MEGPVDWDGIAAEADRGIGAMLEDWLRMYHEGKVTKLVVISTNEHGRVNFSSSGHRNVAEVLGLIALAEYDMQQKIRRLL